MRLDLGAVDERRPLLDPEPVLLVDDEQPEVGELHVLLDQRVRADDDAGLAGRGVVQRLLAGLGAERAGEQLHPGGAVGSPEHAALREVAEQRR